MQEHAPLKRGRPVGSKSFDPASAAAFGAAVREQRLLQGLSQEELAYRAQVERSHMGKVERGLHQLCRVGAGVSGMVLGCQEEIFFAVSTRQQTGDFNHTRAFFIFGQRAGGAGEVITKPSHVVLRQQSQVTISNPVVARLMCFMARLSQVKDWLLQTLLSSACKTLMTPQEIFPDSFHRNVILAPDDRPVFNPRSNHVQPSRFLRQHVR